MNVQAQIDNLIASLRSLKASIDESNTVNATSFIEEFESSLGSLEESIEAPDITNLATATPLPEAALTEASVDPVPDWFDPQNPRRPSSMQIMEIMTGKKSDEIFKMSNFKELSQEASDLLYGVIGSKADGRDWAQILTSGNIIDKIKSENGALLNPTIEVKNTFSNNGVPISSEVLITDADGIKLRTVRGDTKDFDSVLERFGVTAASLKDDLNGIVFTSIEANTRAKLQALIS